MPNRAPYLPQHRSVALPRRGAPRRAVRRVLFSAVAAVVTGATVTGGLLGTSAGVSRAAVAPQPEAPLSPGAPAPSLSEQDLAERGAEAPSRSADRRRAADPVKAASLRRGDGPALARTERGAPADPRAIARALLPRFGFSADQFGCLDALYVGESNWRVDADNPTSSAYGIPQALPGEKMASAGADWATNPETQIRWGLGYIRDSYGSPCSANAFKESNGWY